MKDLFVLTLLMLFSTTIAADNAESPRSFLCISSKIIAFVKSSETGEWEPTSLPGDNFKFVVRPPKSGDISSEGMPFLAPRAYAVFQVGSNFATTECTEEISKYGWLSCGLEFNRPFKMNTNTMRFIFSRHGSYLHSKTAVLNEDGTYAEDADGNYVTREMEDAELVPVLSVIGTCDEL